MPAAQSTDETNGRAGLWSGAAVSPGSELSVAVAATFVVLAVPAMLVLGLLLAVVPGLPWWLGAVLGLLGALASVWVLAHRADRVVLSSIGPVADPSTHPDRLINMVEGLTLAGGVITPTLLVVDDPSRNAAAIRRRDRNHLVLTTGLLDALDVVELEGAVAELLTRLRNGDAEMATIGAALLGRPMIDSPLRPILSPLASAVLARLLPSDRDLEADRQAVTLTKYPPGLIKALEALEGHDVAPGSLTDGTAHLWLADPAPPSPEGADRRAPLSLRIDALSEL